MIRNVRRYYPSEYDKEEMYIWCDEVSSMLVTEDRQSFRRINLPVGVDGSFLLPEGVDMENAVYFICGDVVVDKKDMREYGNRKYYVKGRNGRILKKSPAQPQTMTVDYLVPYTPIRRIRYCGGVTLDKGNDEASIDYCEFAVGDTVNISLGTETVENVPVLAVRYEDRYILTFPEDSLASVSAAGSEQAVIERVVTDMTVCPPPFDSMYIDYVLAKINMFQRDMESYNQFMTAFNSRLSAYKRWLISRMPKGDGRFRNWW